MTVEEFENLKPGDIVKWTQEETMKYCAVDSIFQVLSSPVVEGDFGSEEHYKMSTKSISTRTLEDGHIDEDIINGDCIRVNHHDIKHMTKLV